jgi:CRISPR-associated protein Csa1
MSVGYFSKRDLYASLRRFHRARSQDPVEEEYRGWNWDKPPLRPRAYLGLGVSEVAYRYCPTMRDVYLRRMGVEGEKNQWLANGELVHRVFQMVSEDVRRELALGRSGWEAYENVSRTIYRKLKEMGVDLAKQRWVVDLYKKLLLRFSADEWVYYFSEYRVDGSMLGLSRNLRVDALVETGVVIEVKLGKPHENYKKALAGYALALEANYEVPVDYGILLYVSTANGGKAGFSWEPVYISTSLRSDFIDARDEVIDMLVSGKEPPRAEVCPETCPFRGVCG